MSKEVYIHYGSDRFESVYFTNPTNNPENIFSKPIGGLWASNVKSEYGWKEWCEGAEFNLCNLKEHFKFTLRDDANIIHIKDFEDIKKLSFIEIHYPLGLTLFGRDFLIMDFEKMIQNGVDGIELHLSGNPLIGTTIKWDCDSIVVLNPDIIEPLE